MSQTFIVTKEHRRFTEFANAVRAEHTIGICHGDAGVGKTNSGRRYANWDALEPYLSEWDRAGTTTPGTMPSRAGSAPSSTPPKSCRGIGN